MNLSQLLAKELELESANSRKLLQVVPTEHLGWKPHQKSFTLGRMASHVAELPHWINRILESDIFDFTKHQSKAADCESSEQLLNFFNEKLEAGLSSLKNASDEVLMQEWTFCRGEYVIFKGSRYEAIRFWMMNHQIHHRGQLTVYLRLLDIPIPGMYGPSADDMIAREKAAAANA